MQRHILIPAVSLENLSGNVLKDSQSWAKPAVPFHAWSVDKYVSMYQRSKSAVPNQIGLFLLKVRKATQA